MEKRLSINQRVLDIAGLVGLLALMGALGAYLVRSEFDTYTAIAGVLGVALSAVYLAFNWETVSGGLRGRRAHFGGLATLIAVAFIGIIALGNVLSTRFYHSFDLTKVGAFTLSEQTINILKGLPQPVKVTGFFSSGSDYTTQRKAEAEDLLKQYAAKTDKLSYEFVNPVEKPTVAREYGVKSDATLVFESGGRRQQVLNVGEQFFTTALIKLRSDTQKKIYFLTGHNERPFDDPQGRGLSRARQALLDEGYLVESLSLATSKDVPADAAALVIAAPRQPLLAEERASLETYVKGNARLLVLLEPDTPPDLANLLKPWGAGYISGVVIDGASSLQGDPLSPVVVSYSTSKIAGDLSMTIFPDATGVQIQPSQPGAAFINTVVAKTSPNSWLETDTSVAEFTPDKDVRGPLPLVVTIDGTAPSSSALPGGSAPTLPKTGLRVVMVGNVEFAGDSLITQVPGNRDLFVNSINWLAEEEELISVRAKPAASSPLLLTGVQQNFIFLTVVILLPLLVVAAGGVVWWRRR